MILCSRCRFFPQEIWKTAVFKRFLLPKISVLSLCITLFFSGKSPLKARISYNSSLSEIQVKTAVFCKDTVWVVETHVEFYSWSFSHQDNPNFVEPSFPYLFFQMLSTLTLWATCGRPSGWEGVVCLGNPEDRPVVRTSQLLIRLTQKGPPKLSFVYDVKQCLFVWFAVVYMHEGSCPMFHTLTRFFCQSAVEVHP